MTIRVLVVTPLKLLCFSRSCTHVPSNLRSCGRCSILLASVFSLSHSLCPNCYLACAPSFEKSHKSLHKLLHLDRVNETVTRTISPSMYSNDGLLNYITCSLHSHLERQPSFSGSSFPKKTRAGNMICKN